MVSGHLSSAIRLAFWVFTALLFLTVIYTIWDNNRIIVIQQEVLIENLPSEFEGYKILLLSDLHGKRFGESQTQITRLINSLDYDVMVIAGDMQKNQVEGMKPLLELLRGIDRETPVFYVAGNNGPFDLVVQTGEILPDGQVLQAEGVTLMTHPVKVDRGGQHIWFAPYFSYIIGSTQSQYPQSRSESSIDDESLATFSEKMIAHHTELTHAYEAISSDDVMICVTHEPLLFKILDEPLDIPYFDLILAGHYHGGQFRLPLIGPIFMWGTPTGYRGFFPEDDHISGLYIGQDIQQYISRGLGASGSIPIFSFRLFNTPEMNVITLSSMAASE